MGSLSEEIWNEGYAHGWVRGWFKGWLERWIESQGEEWDENLPEKLAKDWPKALREGRRCAALRMLEMGGFALDKIAAITNLSLDEVRQLASAPLPAAP